MACRPQLGQFRYRTRSLLSLHTFRSLSAVRLAHTLHISSVVHEEHEQYTSQSVSGSQNASHLLASLPIMHDSSVIWGRYNELVSSTPLANIPLELHEIVLRKIRPPDAEARRNWSLHRVSGLSPVEGRMKTILQNIRWSGYEPSLEDYHVILAFYAVIGHHIAAYDIYKQIRSSRNCSPTADTITQMLLAIVRSLERPIHPNFLPSIKADARSITAELLSDLSRLNIPQSGLVVDLSIRAYKHAFDKEGLIAAVKEYYGVDLEYPDMPFEPPAKGQPFLPLSSEILTTIIETLGSLNETGLMVQAFETCTKPLPPIARQRFATEEDGEEDDFGVQFPAVQSLWVSPDIEPRTGTFTALLRHLSKHDCPALSKTYLIQAIKEDRSQSNQVHHRAWLMPRSQFEKPRVIVTRAMFMPVLTIARRQNTPAMQYWVSRTLGETIRVKLNDFFWLSKNFYQAFLIPGAQISQHGPVEAEATPSLVREKSSSIFSWNTSALSFQSADANLVEKEEKVPALKHPYDLETYLKVMLSAIEGLVHLEHSMTVHDENARRAWIRHRAQRVARGQPIFLTPGLSRQLSLPEDLSERPVLIPQEQWNNKMTQDDQLASPNNVQEVAAAAKTIFQQLILESLAREGDNSFVEAMRQHFNI